MASLVHCSPLPFSTPSPYPLMVVLALCASPIVHHPRAPAVFALSAGDVSIPRRRRRLAKRATADDEEIPKLPGSEPTTYVSKGTALCPPTGPTPTVSPAVPQALKAGLFFRTTARTPPSFTPLLPGLIAGGIGITLLPQRPWIPQEADPQRGVRYHPTSSATPTTEPYLEEGEPGGDNVTGRLGSVAYLDCEVETQQDLTVTWLQRRDDSIQLLTVGRQPYSSDSRFLLSLYDPSNWRLQIWPVKKIDEGLYECQIATHPVKVRKVFFQVTAPELKIVDEDRNELVERHYKAGSEVKLTCLATQLQEEDGVGAGDGSEETEEVQDVSEGAEAADNNSRSAALRGVVRKILWRHGDSRITRSAADKTIRPTSSADGRDASVVLTIHDIKSEDEGNYTCSLGEASSEVVHIKIFHGQNTNSNGTAYAQRASTIELWLTMCIVILSLSTL